MIPNVQIQRGTRILFVWPNTRISVWDVANGYRTALSRVVGEECIRDYRLDVKSEYHVRAMIADPMWPMAPGGGKVKPPIEEVALRASQAIVNEVIYHNADLVFIVSGFGVHPVVAWSLQRLAIPTAVVLTESPYSDPDQADWCTSNPDMRVFTTDSYSARKFGWVYLPHAYDPRVHRQVKAEDGDRCDVLMVGTGWTERHKMIEAVDWSGVDLRLIGYWPDAKPGTPLHPFIRHELVNNRDTVRMYAGAKVVLNIHRHHDHAYSLNPRVYEVAACGAFQLTDARPELGEVFGTAIPTFNSPAQLGAMARWYIANDGARVERATEARRLVYPFTFDHRTQAVLIPAMAGATPGRIEVEATAHA